MADNRALRDPKDRTRINLNEQREVRYWTTEFDVDEETLRDAVDQFGPIAQTVREALARARKASHRPARAARPSPIRTSR